jgi:hypothetical protein
MKKFEDLNKEKSPRLGSKGREEKLKEINERRQKVAQLNEVRSSHLEA